MIIWESLKLIWHLNCGLCPFTTNDEYTTRLQIRTLECRHYIYGPSLLLQHTSIFKNVTGSVFQHMYWNPSYKVLASIPLSESLGVDVVHSWVYLYEFYPDISSNEFKHPLNITSISCGIWWWVQICNLCSIYNIDNLEGADHFA